MTPLRVIAVSDGKPGHEKQTRAVVEAMQCRTPVAVHTCLLPARRSDRLRQTVREGVHRRFRQIGASSAADLIIGAGRRTHLTILTAKMLHSARAVVCMNPDLILRPWFDLCLVPRHDKPPARRNIFTTFGPPCMKVEDDKHDADKALILAGGIDRKSHNWDTPAFMAQIRTLCSRMPDKFWSISSSPRTPIDTVEQLTAFAAQRPNVSFYRSDDTPRGWIEDAYKWHDQVWVTADSVSMVYEALTAGCRVGALPVAWKNPQNKFKIGISDLAANGLIIDFEHWCRGQQWPAGRKTLNEAARCASEILKRWWPDRFV